MKKWKIQKTLLIVGEGYSDVAFLNHIKQFPGVCGQGTQITIKNARGYGASGVINWTIRQIANVSYDKVAVMIDTDANWDQKVASLAKKNKIQVIESDPCLEALLLRVLGQNLHAAKDLKTQLAPFVKNDSLTSANYAENFGRDILVAARARETAIRDLLVLFDI